MPAEINEREVERRLDRLLTEYGEVPIERETWERPPGKFDRLADDARDGYVGGAYAWVVRRPEDAAPLTESMPEEANGDARQALMIRNRANEKWGLPGGGLESGETYEEAVVREVREETSIDCEPTDCFLVRRVEAVSADDADERVHLLYAFFDATYEDGSIAVQPGELDGAAWFADPPARMLPANERRAESWDPELDE